VMLGLGAYHTFFFVVVPIMAGGVGEGAIPLSIGYAAILGQPQTGSHDATNVSQQKEEVDKAIESWNAMAVKAQRAGIPIYSHSHQIPWSFLLDSGPRDAKGYTRSSGIRVMVLTPCPMMNMACTGLGWLI